MKLILKIGVVLALLLVLLLAGIVFLTVKSIDRVAKEGIERGETYALDVPTTLGSASVGIFSGKFGMSGINVSNPAGFSSPHFLDLGDGGVEVSLSSLLEETVEIPLLAFSDIDVNLQRENGKSNYKTILDNLKRFESGDSSSSEPASSGEGKKFVINRVEIRNINAHVQLLPIGGEASKIDVNVPEVILTDIGKDGMSMSELVNVLTQAILTSVVKVGGQLPGEILNDLTGQLGGLKGLSDTGMQVLNDSGKVVEQFGAQAEELTKNANETIDGVKDQVDGIKGLLGGDKDK